MWSTGIFLLIGQLIPVCLFVFSSSLFYISDKFYIQYIKNASQDLEDLRNNIIHSIQVHSLSTALGGRGSCYSRFSRDVTAAILVYGTIVENFDSIIMQNLGDILYTNVAVSSRE